MTIRDIRVQTAAMLLGMLCTTVAYAQQPQPTATVPKLVRFSGSFRPINGPADGTPSQFLESVTLSVYRDQTAGDALWHEIQNVVVDADGHYSVLMGATLSEGMPLDLFSSGEQRWLGIQFNRRGEAEQPRVLLVSVPYALKAVDAETLGGKPASAYLLATPAVGTDTASASGAAAAATNTVAAVKPKAIPANSGLPNFIGKFVNSTDLIDSAMYEVNGNVGIFTTAPAIALDVRTGSLPQVGIAGTTDYLTFFASDKYGPAIYWDPAKDMRFGKGGAGLYNPYGFVEQLRIQSSTGNVGIGTIAPGSALDVAGDINMSGNLRSGGTPVLKSFGVNDLSLGSGALQSNTTGANNTATGFDALQANTSGFGNTAFGNQSLQSNTTGGGNTAIGNQALLHNTTAASNTSTGSRALLQNTTGDNNTASGTFALQNNTTGGSNTASGASALTFNTIGGGNTATGYGAMGTNTTGDSNTATGSQALQNNTTGGSNTAIGAAALGALASGDNNIAIGLSAGSNLSSGESNNIAIGSPGVAGNSGVIRIGSVLQTKFFAAGVFNVTTGQNNAIPVMIDVNGQLGTISSSRRFKEDIEDMGAASRDLMRLRPVTYRYRQPFADGSKPIQYGLIAEEVAEVYPDLVARSADGKIETVKYQVLDSMLLNEVQRHQATAERQQEEIRRLEQRNQSLEERLARLEAALVSMSGVARVSGAQ